jgi:hypothetical protein
MGQVGEDRIFSDHNVYILGAGFSVDAGIPVLKDFLYAMRDSLNYLRENGREWERKAVENVLVFRKQAASAALRVSLNLENIEDLFSLASASPSPVDGPSVPIAIAATIDCAHSASKRKLYEASIAHTFQKPSSWSKKTDGQTDAIYRLPIEDAYVGLISGAACNKGKYTKNTIISFNYDLVVEESLKGWGRKIRYGFDEGDIELDDQENYSAVETNETVSLFKIHGSINWTQPRGKKKLVRICSSYSDIVALQQNMILVPPTWKKGTNGALNNVWNEAVKALSNATRIVIIGFSLPATDIHIRYLLAAGLQENISLRNIYCFNPAEIVKSNLFEVLRPELETQQVVKFDTCEMKDLILNFANNYQPKSMLFNRDISPNLRNLTLASE